MNRSISLLIAGFSAGTILLNFSPSVSAEAEQSASQVSSKSATSFHLFPGPPRVAISAHGNLVRFEGPTGYDHIGVGAFSEGYVLCYGSSRAYDTGASESGFGASTASCTTSTCTVTRNTSDNKLQLKQVINFNKGIRTVSFAMTLKNLTGGNLTGVILRRQADTDVDTGGASGTGDFDNWFGASEFDSVFAWNPANASASDGHAVVLAAKTPKQGIAKVTSSILDDSCNPTNIAANGPVFGDHGITIQHNFGTMAGGSSRAVTVNYTRN